MKEQPVSPLEADALLAMREELRQRIVARMGLNPVNAFATRFTLGWLRRRAHPAAEFRRLAASSTFGRCDISTDGVGVEVRLHA